MATLGEEQRKTLNTLHLEIFHDLTTLAELEERCKIQREKLLTMDSSLTDILDKGTTNGNDRFVHS